MEKFDFNSCADGVIYARYSSHSQRDVSIEQQIRACRLFADRHGIRIVHIYEDRAVTGTSDKRPGFQSMITDARKATWNYVIVYTLDRFARDRYDSAVYKRQLKDCGVKVLSAMENISDDPTGVLMESLLEGLAEYYSKELSRKIKRGMEDNASKCMVNGSLPLGYVRGADGRYAIDESEAAIVREIFQRVLDGDRFCQIIDDLNARGIRTKLSRAWNKSSFNKLLSNERYVGVYLYGETRIPGGIPAIVSQSVFDAVQLRLHTKGNARRSDVPQRRRREDGVYLLTGKLYCGHCKSPMVGLSGKGKLDVPYFYYTCKGRRSGGSCDKKNVRREQIEQFVATALRDTMLTDTAIEALANAAVEFQQKHERNADIEALRVRLVDIRKSIGNLLAAMEAGIFTPATKDRLMELEEQQRTVSAQLAQAEEDAEAILTREEIIAALQFYQYGDVTDKDYQQALIDTFLVAAYVYDREVRFVFNLTGHPNEATISFDIDEINLSNVCTTSPSLHQTSLYKHFGVTVVVIGDLFVFSRDIPK